MTTTQGDIMPTHAQLAGRLLRDAAQFFRTVGEQNQPLKEQMDENATVFEQVATLVEQDPSGTIPEDPSTSVASLGARLLRDASQFFRTVGEQNQPLKEQMDENATVFEQVATLVEQDPSGEIPDEPPQGAA